MYAEEFLAVTSDDIRKEFRDIENRVFEKKTAPAGEDVVESPEQREGAFEDREIRRLIKKGHPHGHPLFIPITLEEIALHSKKNHDYAAGGDPLGNFTRVSMILMQYPNLDLSDPAIVAMVYMLKQLDAYLWAKSNGHDLKVEGLDGRLADISIYAKIVRCMERENPEPLSEEDIDRMIEALREKEGDGCPPSASFSPVCFG